ncbi:MAG: hypothetical protein FWG79_07230 [Bacteroidales bacterium]|nr:hypothetical protein [Bacteroidales bacterium]
MNKAKLLITLLAISTLHLSAQRPSNEFSISGGAGLSLLVSNDASATGLNPSAGIGYTLFFSEHVGLHIGAEWSMNTMDIRVDHSERITLGLTDANGLRYNLHTTLSGYEENLNSMFISVPVMLQFQANPTTHSFYAMGGAKILLFHGTSYESKLETYHNAAYYPDFYNWASTQTFAGLGRFSGRTTFGNTGLDMHLLLSLETGMKWRIGENTFLYTGAYLDYGLSDPLRGLRVPVSDYIATAEVQSRQAPLLTFSDKVNMMTVGIKLRLAFARSSTPKMRQAPRRVMVPCPPGWFGYMHKH